MTAELVARLTLDNQKFVRALDDSDRRADRFGKRFGSTMSGLNAAFRSTSAVVGGAMAFATLAINEFAKTNEDAARQIVGVKKASTGLLADIGRDLVGGTQRISTFANALRSLRTARSDFVDFLARPFNKDVDEVNGLLRANEEMDRQRRVDPFIRQTARDIFASVASSPAERRMLEVERIRSESRSRLESINSAEHLTSNERRSLVAAEVSRRDIMLGRLDRVPPGVVEQQTAEMQSQIFDRRRRLMMTRPNSDEALGLEREIVNLTAALERLNVFAAADGNLALGDAEANAQINREMVGVRFRRDVGMIEIADRQRRLERERRATSFGVAGDIIDDDIASLHARGQGAQARRLSLAIGLRRREFDIMQAENLSDAQKAALLGSARSRFEAEFAALGSGRTQQVLGAGAGSLAGQVFAAPVQQLDIQKSMDATLKEINQKMDTAFTAVAG